MTRLVKTLFNSDKKSETSRLTGPEKLTQGAVEVIARRFAATPFTLQQLEQAGLEWGMTGSEAACALASLSICGKAAAWMRSDGRTVFALKRETLNSWHHAFFDKSGMTDGQEHEEWWPISGNGQTQNAGNLKAVRMLVMLLVRMDSRKVKPTLAGQLPKTVSRKLEKELFLPEAVSENAAQSSQRLIDFFMEYGRKTDLIGIQDGYICMSRDKMHDWTGQSIMEAEQELLSEWQMWSWPEEPLLQHAAVVLHGMRISGWFTIGDVVGRLEQRLGIPRLADGLDVLDTLEQFFFSELIGPLVLAGWLIWEKQTDDVERYRWGISNLVHRDTPATDCAHSCPPTQWFVQKDFEIIVLGDPQLDAIWELEGLAECLHADAAFVYRLCRDSLWRSFDAGRTAAECLLLLEKRALSGVPASVSQAVNDWEAEWIRSEQASVVEPSHQEKNVKMARPGNIQRKSPWKEEGAREITGVRALRIPGPDELFPGWRSVPAAWLSSCRSYHPSTRLEMARYALLWKTRVKLRRGTEERLVYPCRIKESADTFLLEGVEGEKNVEIRLNEWDSLQILLPDMGDSWYDMNQST